MRTQVFPNLLIAVSLALPAINLHAQQGLPSAASVITGEAPMAATAATAVPGLVPFSGIAVGRNGKPVTGESSVTFLIFKDQQGGEPLFTESQMISFDEAGHYKVQLGAANTNGLPPSLFSSGEARWLEIQITGQPVEPRVLLASVPYALKASDAATLGGLPASAFALASTVSGTTSATANAITPDAASTVTTTGGTNLYVPRFSGAATIVNSEIYDTGTSVGIGDTPNASAKLDVNGAMIMRGNMQVTRTGNATTAKGAPSYGFQFYSNVYNSSTKATDNPYFQLQSEPSGNNTASPTATFNLLFSNNGSAPAETGFYISPNGTIHFASGQAFPGTGTGNGTITGVTAGTGLTGGGTSGNVTLNVNTATIPTLGGNNTMSGNNTYTGSNVFGPSIYENTDVNIDNTNSNPGNISPGLRFGNASGEGMSSQRTSGTNQYGLDLYTGYSSRMSITAAGAVGINTRTPYAQLEVFSNGPNGDAIAGFGGFANSYGYAGTAGYGGDTDGSSGSAGGDGGAFFGGAADTSADAGYGIYAVGGDGDNDGNNAYSGVFMNDIQVSGNTVSDVSSSKIDSPTDPANKYLVHASIQSSELMNLYTGNVTTDSAGHATVALPAWFEAENTDFRYQLTVVGQFAQAVVKDEIANGQFTIMSSVPGVKVSWQVTAVRQDAYAKAHPMLAEIAKPAREVGFYKHPELFGQPANKQTEWGRNPKMMQRIEAQRTLAKARSLKVAAPVRSTPGLSQAGTSTIALQSTLNPPSAK